MKDYVAPSRERGLKPHSFGFGGVHGASRSFTGAWIETGHSYCKKSGCCQSLLHGSVD